MFWPVVPKEHAFSPNCYIINGIFHPLLQAQQGVCERFTMPHDGRQVTSNRFDRLVVQSVLDSAHCYVQRHAGCVEVSHVYPQILDVVDIREAIPNNIQAADRGRWAAVRHHVSVKAPAVHLGQAALSFLSSPANHAQCRNERSRQNMSTLLPLPLPFFFPLPFQRQRRPLSAPAQAQRHDGSKECSKRARPCRKVGSSERLVGSHERHQGLKTLSAGQGRAQEGNAEDQDDQSWNEPLQRLLIRKPAQPTENLTNASSNGGPFTSHGSRRLQTRLKLGRMPRHLLLSKAS